MNKFVTNLAFIILIVFLLIGAIKSQQNSPVGFRSLGDLSNFMPAEKKEVVEVEEEHVEVVNEFEGMQDVAPTPRVIDKSTALSYVKIRPITGTEMLALARLRKIAPHLNKGKVIVLYINQGNSRDIRAFMSEFAKTREHFSNDSRFVFLPVIGLWEVDENNIKNSNDRVMLNLKKDCGYFCVFDTEREKMIRMNGSNVNKKSAEIMDVILKSL